MSEKVAWAASSGFFSDNKPVCRSAKVKKVTSERVYFTERSEVFGFRSWMPVSQVDFSPRDAWKRYLASLRILIENMKHDLADTECEYKAALAAAREG